ncbi:MAG: hypothetical protein KF718_25080, partial [Polyangiaceae bacterium]|nr:hypothetical protein [Polyangiaceae bacterium]
SGSGGSAGGCATLGITGDTITFDGTNDLDKLASTQILTPGAQSQSWSRFGMTWNDDHLFIAVVSEAFEADFRPVHIYLEADTALGTAAGADGKEYSSLTAKLPFTPTHLIAVRSKNDGGAGNYNGVYLPASAWANQSLALVENADTFLSADKHTVSVRVPRQQLGCPTELRVAVHVVNAVSGNEWKDVVPGTHTPWAAAATGYYELSLKSNPPTANWQLK